VGNKVGIMSVAECEILKSVLKFTCSLVKAIKELFRWFYSIGRRVNLNYRGIDLSWYINHVNLHTPEEYVICSICRCVCRHLYCNDHGSLIYDLKMPEDLRKQDSPCISFSLVALNRKFWTHSLETGKKLPTPPLFADPIQLFAIYMYLYPSTYSWIPEHYLSWKKSYNNPYTPAVPLWKKRGSCYKTIDLSKSIANICDGNGGVCSPVVSSLPAEL
jgi:hypothetical protein